MWIVILLLYTALIVPFKVCFVEKTPDPEFIFDLFVDLSFAIDIVLTFFTAIEVSEGVITVDKKKIAMLYIKSWFFIDVFTTIPFQIGEKMGDQTGGNGGNSKALRLARLPRLYRLLRIFRLFKLLKVMKTNRRGLLSKILQIGHSFRSMFKIVASILYINHLMACFWYF